MKKLLALAGMMLAGSAMAATPTIDGTIEGAWGTAAYRSAASPSTFGAGQYIDGYYVTDDASNVYIALEGNSSYNNAFIIYVDVSDVTGKSAQPLPSVTGGGGAAASSAGTKLPLTQVDYAFSFNSSDTNAAGATAGYLDAIDYTAASPAPTYLGSDTISGNATDTSSQTGSWTTTSGTGTVTFAYSDNDTVNSATGTVEGLELSIPKSVLGVTATSTVKVYAAFTSGGAFFSNQTLPDNGSSSNLGNTPDLSAAAAPGSINVPVELSTFSAE